MSLIPSKQSMQIQSHSPSSLFASTPLLSSHMLQRRPTNSPMQRMTTIGNRGNNKRGSPRCIDEGTGGGVTAARLSPNLQTNHSSTQTRQFISFQRCLHLQSFVYVPKFVAAKLRGRGLSYSLSKTSVSKFASSRQDANINRKKSPILYINCNTYKKKVVIVVSTTGSNASSSISCV